MDLQDYLFRLAIKGHLAGNVSSQDPIQDLANAVLADEDEYMRQKFSQIGTVPKLSTFSLGAVIRRVVSQMPDNQAYVNIGVWHGFSLLAAMIDNPNKRIVGVDNFSQFGSPRDPFLYRFNTLKSDNHFFYDMDYVDFFGAFHYPIGFYFYDGEHSYENQLKGLQLAEPFFAENCIVMIDDTNWEAPRKAMFDFLSTSPNRYKVLLDSSHPTFWNGAVLLQRIDSTHRTV